MQKTTDTELAEVASCDLASVFEDLCAHFDGELVRQQAVLDACRAQGEAARDRDHEALRRATEVLVVLMQDALDAEKERLTLLHGIVGELGLTTEQQTLTCLIERAPEPWRSRMGRFQVAIREILGATQIQVRKDSAYIRRAGRIIDRSVRTALGNPETRGDAYDKGGNEPGAGNHAPALVNTVG